MNHKIAKGQWTIAIAGSVTTLLALFLCVTHFPLGRHIDHIIYDQFLQKNHTPPVTRVPLIIDIDERSLREAGQWPWPRYQVAFLLKTLQQYEVAAVATDIIFAEPDMSSPINIQRNIKNILGVDIKFSGLPDSLKDNDKLLASNLKTGPFILGFDFITNPDQAKGIDANCELTPINPTIISSPGAIPVHEALPQAVSAICPLPLYSSNAPGAGFITIAADEDAIYRRVPLLFSWEENVYPSLALAALRQAFPEQNVVVKLNERGVQSIRFGNSVIPTDRQGKMLINYRGPSRTFDYISAIDILQRKASPADLKGRIAFIGTSAAGLKDIRPTSLDPGFPGVEVHATIVDNILSGQPVRQPEWAILIELSAVVITGAAITILLMWTNALWLSVPAVILSLGIWFGSSALFTHFHFFASPLYPIFTLVITFTFITAIKYWREEKAKEYIHSAFSHYLAPSVISQIMESPDLLKLEGQEKEVSIQFSDVRDFTSISEKLPPKQVTTLLHDYLTPMTEIITQHNGTLDKFIGDAVMAFWNAPVDVENHQIKSVKAALAQQKELAKLNNIFLESYGITIQAGIGLHSGLVHVGNMGTTELFDYTLIGDNVNLASRIEGLTKFYGLEILVSRSIVTACGDDFLFRFIDKVKVKGKAKPVAVYTVYEHDDVDHRIEEFNLFDKALESYAKGQFAETMELIRKLKTFGTDDVLYSLYEKRCNTLINNPPEVWDGIYQHTKK
ncbi:Nucleotide cyclase [Pseudodesulfovibrio profundus]|uniref:Nucleotide cyclase n=1 Tax=Pseudodesulfovibrio profundus TaxID=57320 RepID=A0A2C8F3V9_9BACT|nr:adenylate/guanylate cyclase domain-containing protein [Pseudodesulfovibrio profundus]SOB57178.1 Nucleotide cyclase [Pseudodesulfovibrio profundus]